MRWSPLPRSASGPPPSPTDVVESILVRIPEEERWHGYVAESLWASRSSSGYVVENVPFLVRGLSFGDIVEARRENGVLELTCVKHRGGHSTFRVYLADGVFEWGFPFRLAWRQIELLGCSFEQATDRLLAVDVPPSTDVRAVYALLEQGERNGVWNFEEGHFGQVA